MKETEKKLKKWFVYILLCADKTLYTGITVDVERRIKQHNGLITGGAKYTRIRKRRPVMLIYKKEYKTMSEASKEEWKIIPFPINSLNFNDSISPNLIFNFIKKIWNILIFLHFFILLENKFEKI